jgi:hypothetical protein
VRLSLPHAPASSLLCVVRLPRAAWRALNPTNLMRIEAVTPSSIADIWTRLESRVRARRFFESAAQDLAELLHQEFRESVVLARVFLTVPFDVLPPVNRRYVCALAESAGVAEELRTVTPVLSLVGTYGVKSTWCDWRKSRNHLGIPLISSDFVEAIPMVSRLLKEMGIPLEWANTHEAATIEKTIGRTAGLFFILDAKRAVDRQGRRIISAKEFVDAYGVTSVFGVGGAYVGGQICVLVVFCRDECTRTAAEHFMALTALFKAKTAEIVGSGRIFAPQ